MRSAVIFRELPAEQILPVIDVPWADAPPSGRSVKLLLVNPGPQLELGATDTIGPIPVRRGGY